MRKMWSHITKLVRAKGLFPHMQMNLVGKIMKKTCFPLSPCPALNVLGSPGQSQYVQVGPFIAPWLVQPAQAEGAHW